MEEVHAVQRTHKHVLAVSNRYTLFFMSAAACIVCGVIFPAGSGAYQRRVAANITRQLAAAHRDGSIHRKPSHAMHAAC